MHHGSQIEQTCSKLAYILTIKKFRLFTMNDNRQLLSIGHVISRSEKRLLRRTLAGELDSDKKSIDGQ